MTARRASTIALLAATLLGIAALFLLRNGTGSAVRVSLPAATSPSVATAAADNSIARPAEVDGPAAGSAIADALNAPDGTLRRDLEILNELFVAFHTNFPALGNPVGENSEITRALTGGNPAKFVFIAPRHRAINARGELCDRWGTPFRFHQLGGSQMEIRSAGPDRKFSTSDDVEFAPWPK